MKNLIIDIVSYSMALLLLVITIICTWKFKALKKEAFFVVLFIYLAFVAQWVSTILGSFGQNNYWVLHLYTIGEFILLGLFYYQLLKLKPKKGQFNWALLGLTICSGLIIYGSFYVDTINGFNPFSRTIECVVMSGMAIVFYIKEIRSLNNLADYDQRREGLVSVNTAVLLLFSGQFFIYLLSDFAERNLANIHTGILWIFNGILNIIFYSILLVGIWKLALPKKNYSGSY